MRKVGLQAQCVGLQLLLLYTKATEWAASACDNLCREYSSSKHYRSTPIIHSSLKRHVLLPLKCTCAREPIKLVQNG